MPLSGSQEETCDTICETFCTVPLSGSQEETCDTICEAFCTVPLSGSQEETSLLKIKAGAPARLVDLGSDGRS